MSETILVTGASGYVASWIVKMLLARGARVHGTVRKLSNNAKTNHLIELADEYPTQLQLFEADLLKPGSFDKAMAGCSLVIHTASPYLFEKPRDPEHQLLKPAVEGTQNVIDSIERTPTVRRLVLTSSVAAMYDSACQVNKSGSPLVSRDAVNPATSAQSNPYAFSKTRAEQLAWGKQREQNRWDMLTVHPGAIFGPSLSHRIDSTSVSMMHDFVKGSFKKGVPRLWLGLVDVRDVAEVHIRAALQGQGGMRYIAVAQNLTLLDIAKLIDGQAYDFEDKLPVSEAPKWLLWLLAPFIGMTRYYVANNVNYPLQFDNQDTVTSLNMSYIEPKLTLNDHVAQLFSDGLVYS